MARRGNGRQGQGKGAQNTAGGRQEARVEEEVRRESRRGNGGGWRARRSQEQVRGARGGRPTRAEGRKAQGHIRFDHCLEGSLALPICKLVHKVARHTWRVAVEPEEAVVVAQSPGCPQCQGVGHARVCLQFPCEVGELRGDVCTRTGGSAAGSLGPRAPRPQACRLSPPELLVKM